MTNKHIIIGERIQKCREKYNISQKDLAEAVHVSQEEIMRCEVGQADIQLLVKLSEYFQVSLNYLLGINTEEQEIEKQILFKYRQLDEQKKIKLFECIDELLQENRRQGERG